jgi:hypothetical protein
MDYCENRVKYEFRVFYAEFITLIVK